MAENLKCCMGFGNVSGGIVLGGKHWGMNRQLKQTNKKWESQKWKIKLYDELIMQIWCEN